MLKPKQDWDDAFANMAHVADSASLPQMWAARAAAYRASGVRVEEVAYGSEAREKFDLVWPDTAPRGLAVFIHGGYWIRLDKSYWTDFAEGARANGWVVCLPSYTLAPQARIGQITQQMAAAISVASARVAGPIRLSGHSAGGHLATRMICVDTGLSTGVLDRVERVLSISGLHDLRPLMHTAMNQDLRLDEAQARQESALLQQPIIDVPLTCWVGGCERPEFIRQAQILSMVWAGLDISTQCIVDAEHNHFTVIEGLKVRDSPICTAFSE